MIRNPDRHFIDSVKFIIYAVGHDAMLEAVDKSVIYDTADVLKRAHPEKWRTFLTLERLKGNKV